MALTKTQNPVFIFWVSDLSLILGGWYNFLVHALKVITDNS